MDAWTLQEIDTNVSKVGEGEGHGEREEGVVRGAEGANGEVGERREGKRGREGEGEEGVREVEGEEGG